MVRRATALGIAFLVFVLLIVFVSSCVSSRRDQALKDYSRDVAGVVQDANENTNEFFATLAGGGGSATEVQSQLNGLRVRAERITNEAEALDVPDDMRQAQNTLLISLGLLETAIGEVSDKIPGALASDANAASEAVRRITAQMQAFTAADVVYGQRTLPLIEETLREKELSGTIKRAAFMQNNGWLDADTVAERIDSQAGAGAGTSDPDSDEPPAPGTHGHGLVSTNVGDITLQPDPAPNRITLTPDLTFSAKVANQGENDETKVLVRVTITGASGSPITASKTVPQTAAGSETDVAVPITKAPPIGAATIKVEVRPVKGEEKTDNNAQEYTVQFQRG